ncbi:MAG: flagellar motor switch protein FliN [Treponema sp.]|jgi:flagellar motor switch protein FliN/FliY|nr:flagellar motor switch protein FliN [Treponema sp.]
MSDGTLSQAELDALLAGTGESSVALAGGNDHERQVLQDFLVSSVDSLSANFSQLTATQVSLKGPEVSFTNQDALLEQLPDMVTMVKADFNAGFPGEHLFIMGEATAKAIAAHMTQEEDIPMDAMALSVIGELVSNLVGTQITALTKQTGNKSIASVSPEASNVPKAVVALPGGDFSSALYQLDLGDGNAQQFWEIYGSRVSESIAHSLDKNNAPAAGSSPLPGNSAMSARGGGMSGIGNSGMIGQPAQVQSVQFPGLTPHPTAQEQGNIGLILDVFMEMTVELGRTKKLIKEILGMGEGTIIELDKLAGEPVDILVNHKLIAKGEVVVIDENFGVRVTEIVPPMERMQD